MQKYCLSALLIALLSTIRAQEVAVMLDKMNVLYAGFDNPLRVVVSDVASERLVLSPSQGEIMTDSSGAYLWRLCECASNGAWLVLSDSTPGKIIDSVFFRVKRFPEPRFKVSKSGHHSAGGVIGYFEDFHSDFLLPLVTGFDLEYIPEKQDPVVIHNTGARFGGSAIEYIYRWKPGDEIYIYNITWRIGCDPGIRKSETVLVFKAK